MVEDDDSDPESESFRGHGARSFLEGLVGPTSSFFFGGGGAHIFQAPWIRACNLYLID